MWSEISKIIGANPVMTIVITIIGTFSIWMYKDHSYYPITSIE
ncbi:hypothetical protein [Paenibacillus aquistagni]|nr:hypothetical protein [Paenibacillus aquistagni]